VSEEGSADATADQALAAAAAAGVHRLALPTPFLVGRVNAYLIEDDPLTLVDTGPNSGTTLDELDTGLRALGHTIADLELIVITHQHMDHLGLLEILVRRSGAEVAALDRLAPYLRDFGASAGADDAYASAIMSRHGVPADVITALSSVGASFRAYGSSAEVTRPLADGSDLELSGRRLRVLHRPGHSPSDTVLWDQRRAMMIAGDHLLAHISSNPLITRPLEGPDPSGERPHALLDYIASLRATREMSLDFVLAGHGEPVTDHVTLIDERLRLHDRRAAKLLRMLADGPLTAYEMALGVWSNVAVTQAYLTISEVLGHMDLLASRGQVAEEHDGGLTRFAATAP
jgi:glyoxylase-like metal-dependent hydrolase (beta-lactamase superfamily II)